MVAVDDGDRKSIGLVAGGGSEWNEFNDSGSAGPVLSIELLDTLELTLLLDEIRMR